MVYSYISSNGFIKRSSAKNRFNMVRLFDDNILQRMQEFAEEKDREMLAAKALRVSNRCRRTGRIDLAEKIDKKYQRDYPKHDFAMALQVLLMWQKREYDKISTSLKNENDTLFKS